jgi:hypothetical protein
MHPNGAVGWDGTEGMGRDKEKRYSIAALLTSPPSAPPGLSLLTAMLAEG